MAGIGDLFGGMFGGPAPTPGLLDAAGYMDPAQYDAARRNQGMMGLWAGLLAGGGPSLEPRNFGSALGAGFTGMNQFGSKFDEDQYHAAQAAAQRAAVQKSSADIDIKKKGYELAKQYLEGGVPGSGSTGGAPAAPGAGGDVPNFGAGSGGGGGWGPHAGTAIETLRAAGYSDAAIQGIMANGLGEGGFKSPWVKAGGGENSFGHWQFNARGELPGYLDFVKQQGGDPQDTRLQALYVAKRAEEVHPGFAKLDDPKLATDIFATKFERYQGAKPGQRYGLLTDAQRYMAGTPVETREALPAGPGGYAPEGAPTGGVPAFAGGRAAALGGPVPAMLAAGAAPAPSLLPRPGGDPNAPAAPVPAPLAGAPSGNRPGANLPASGAGLITPQDYQQWLATQQPPGGGNIRIEPLGSETVPAGDAAAAPAAPQLGVGGALSRTMGVPIPAAAVAPAPPVPVAPAATQPPAVAAAPSPGATQPPGAPGPLTVTLPAPPAPVAMPTIPAAQALPAAPEIPGVPARPQMPGVSAGAAVSPAIAARARQAQGVVLGLSMMGVHVPDFLQKEAGIEIAGRTAAAEAEAKQPIELQNKAFEASLTSAQKRWDALNDQQKETLAFQRGLTKDQMNAMYSNIHEQYKSLLGLTTARAMEGEKTAGGAENTQTTMVIGNREVPMTVAQANRISRGEAPDLVLGPGVMQLGKAANTGPIPEGYQMVPGGAGGGTRMEPLPGSPQARAIEQKQTSQQQNASVVTQDLRRAQDLVTGGYVTGLYGRGSQHLPGTDRTRFDALVSGIGANFSIDRLQQMRDASPTGGALGQVTEGEHKLLRDSVGSLNPEQGEKQLSENIARVHQRYMDIVNGTPEQIGKLLREGKITKDRHDTLIAQRDLPTGGEVGGAIAGSPIDKAAYDRLPSGTPYTAPDGSRRIKP